MNRYKFDKEVHLHSLDGKPLFGTSTIVGVLSKPLTWWASGKALELLGWTNAKVNNKKVPIKDRLALTECVHHNIGKMSNEEFLALLDRCYRNHKDSLDKSADKGVDLHAELEGFIKDRMERKDIGQAYDIKIAPFIEWSITNVKKFLWSEAHCFSEDLWTGGIADAGAELNDGSVCLIDFKSAKDVYTSHFLQCAGYIYAIEENGLLDSEGNTILKLDKPISKMYVVPFGAKIVEPKANELSIAKYIEGFKAAVVLNKLIKAEGV